MILDRPSPPALDPVSATCFHRVQFLSICAPGFPTLPPVFRPGTDLAAKPGSGPKMLPCRFQILGAWPSTSNMPMTRQSVTLDGTSYQRECKDGQQMSLNDT